MDLSEKQGSSGSALTDIDGMSMTDMVAAFGQTWGAFSITQALQQAAFLVCCDILAQDMAKAPLQLCTRLKNGTYRVMEAKEHEAAAFLALDPNYRHTWFEFKEMMGLWGAISSNSYAVVKRAPNGDALELIPVQFGNVSSILSGRAVFYDVTAGSIQEAALLGGSFLRVPERDMIHVRSRILNGFDGYSTMMAGRKTLQTGEAIETYRDDLFSDGAEIRGVFEKELGATILPEEVFNRLRSQLKLMMNRFSRNKEPIILEGLKFSPIASNPQDAELTKQFEAQIVATGRLLRIPPQKMFHLVNVKYENLDTMEKSYIGDTMEPFLQRYEGRYDRALLSDKDRLAGLTIRHNREALLLTDYKAETERLSRMVERSVIKRNEARGKMGLSPDPDGDVYLLPSGYSLVKEDGTVVAASSKPSSDAGTTPAPDQPAQSGKTELHLVKG
ncbi:phage portal protein [Pleomorphomonas sp. PLEO]|uniref:phage portal protein n=1 Tax=Pleomorphomonas sp. PLEO TaxID=3239306 RepID=UPI00351F312C